MNEEGAGGKHVGEKRQRRRSLGKPWSKYHQKLGGDDGEIVTHIRGQGGKSGAGERGFGDAGMDTCDTQVGG